MDGWTERREIVERSRIIIINLREDNEEWTHVAILMRRRRDRIEVGHFNARTRFRRFHILLLLP